MPQGELNLAKLTPPLARWCADSSSGEQKTVVIKMRNGQEPKQAASDMRELGAEIESTGRRVITAVVSPATLARIAGLKGVLSVEEPRELELYG